MQLSNLPGKLVLPFANAGGKNTIPAASQIGVTAGAASLTDGFPPLTRTPIAAGGVPPSGLDMNGILFELSAIVRWANAGGGYPFDGTFAADSNVGGYPAGARVLRSDGLGYWFNTTDNNVTDPNASTALADGWVPDFATGAAAISMTNANVTLTALQYGKRVIVITGILAADLNLIFPPLVGNWTVINATSGAHTITAKTAAGVGVTVTQGFGEDIYCDGTAIGSPLARLSAQSGGAQIGYLPAGTGAVPTNLSAFLNLKVRGLKRNYGAALDGVTDDTSKLINAINDGKIIEIEEGTALITGSIPNLATGQRIVGWDRYQSKVKFSGAINGFVIAPHGSIEDLRIIADASMPSTNGCIDVGKTGSAYRSAIKRCIVGGQSTSLGDAANIRSGGNGMIGGAGTFLINFDDVYFFNSAFGFKNIENAGNSQVNNAMSFTACEFQSNGIGAALSRTNAVDFTQCTFEGNDREGLILGNSNGGVLDACYFEGNNLTTGSSVKSDLYIGNAAAMVGSGAQVGTSLSVKNCYFAAGTNSAYGIYLDGQRGVDCADGFFANYGTNSAITVLSSVNNSGSIDRIYIASAGPIVIGALALPGFRLGRYSWTGFDHFALQNSISGVTASLAAGATSDIFGCTSGETYLLTVGDAANGTGISMTAVVQCTAAATLVITILQSTGTTVTNFFGSMRIANSTAGALALAWSVTRIK